MRGERESFVSSPFFACANERERRERVVKIKSKERNLLFFASFYLQMAFYAKRMIDTREREREGENGSGTRGREKKG